MKIHQLLEMPIEPTGDPNDPTVYGHERANPMSLKGRIQQARNQLQELAKAAESDDLVVWESICKKAQGGMFMGLEQNLEQIRHGIEELAQRRRKGGSNARGIDKNIGEAKGPAQQAAIAIAMKKSGKKPKGVAEAGSNAIDTVAKRLTDPKDGMTAKLRAAGDARREDKLKGRNISRRDTTSKDEWGNLKQDVTEDLK